MLAKACKYMLIIWILTMVGITVWGLLITDEVIEFTWDKFAVVTIAQFAVGIPTFWLIGRLAQKKKINKND